MTERVTLVFTDLLESTATNSRIGDAAMADLLIAHDRRSRELLRRTGGREIDHSDGYLLLFRDTEAALAFTSSYHRMLSELAVPMKARAAIHVGDVELRTNVDEAVGQGAKPLEVFGIAKAYGHRLMTLAHGGQTLASAAAAGEIAAAGGRCRSHGFWRLKGLTEPIELFEVGEDAPFIAPVDGDKGCRVVFSAGQWIGLREVPRNLPREPHGLIGRERDQRDLSALLTDGARVVTLTGAGGIGKTRLALRYAWGWLGDYPGGVYFCELAQTRSAEDVVRAVAAALQLPPEKDPLTQVGRAIAGRGRCLLVLDNFEQVIRHAPSTVGKWSEAAAQACFLSTSRERLSIPGEQVLALSPLAPDAAIELFHASARAAHSGYEPAATPTEVMRSLVELLDGLPLAIELAAARVVVLSPAELLARMGQRFRLLSAGGSGSARHATLHATLAWSWELLNAAERAALAQVSVFEGGFDLAAAEAVLAPEQQADATWTLDLLQSLVGKSLIRPQADGRFTLLRSIQDFAAEKLVDTEAEGRGAGAARARHRRYYASLDEARVVAAHGIELDNLAAAVRNAAAAGDGPSAAACLRLTWAVLRLTGPFKLGVELATQVQAMPRHAPADQAMAEWVLAMAHKALGQFEHAHAAVDRGLAAVPESADALRARLQCARGELLGLAGRSVEGESWLAKALALADRAGEAAVRCHVLNAIGTLHAECGRSEAARQAFEAAIAIAAGAGERRWQGGVLGNLGVLLMNAGRYREAEDACDRALKIALECGDRRWEGNALCNLGFIHLQQRALDRAEPELEQALHLARQLGHRALEVTTLCNLGLVSDARGDVLTASARHREAVAGAQRMGDARTEAQLGCCLGASLARAGLHEEARGALARALELARRTEDPTVICLALCALAEAQCHSAEKALAEQTFAEALQEMAATDQESDSELARRIEEVRSLIRG